MQQLQQALLLKNSTDPTSAIRLLVVSGPLKALFKRSMQHKHLQKFQAYKGSFIEGFAEPFEMLVPTIEEVIGQVLDIVENDFNNITFQETRKNSFISTGMAPYSTGIFKKPENVLKELWFNTLIQCRQRQLKLQYQSDDEEFKSDDEYFYEIEVDMRDNDGSR